MDALSATEEAIAEGKLDNDPQAHIAPTRARYGVPRGSRGSSRMASPRCSRR